MGKPRKEEENEEEETYFKQATSMVVDYVFSMVIPVAILIYAAPSKSVDFIVESVKEKVDLVIDINFDDVWEALANVYKEMIPMLQAELEVLQTVSSQPWASYFTLVYSKIEFLPWYVFAGAAVVTLLVIFFVPWRTIAGWVAKTVWRTVFLFIGMLPVDDGFSLLSDKDAGNYQIFVVVLAAVLTLIANYLLWVIFWASLRFVTRGIWGLVRGKKEKKPSHHKEKSSASKSVTVSVGSEDKKDV